MVLPRKIATCRGNATDDRSDCDLATRNESCLRLSRSTSASANGSNELTSIDKVGLTGNFLRLPRSFALGAVRMNEVMSAHVVHISVECCGVPASRRGGQPAAGSRAPDMTRRRTLLPRRLKAGGADSGEAEGCTANANVRRAAACRSSGVPLIGRRVRFEPILAVNAKFLS